MVSPLTLHSNGPFWVSYTSLCYFYWPYFYNNFFKHCWKNSCSVAAMCHGIQCSRSHHWYPDVSWWQVPLPQQLAPWWHPPVWCVWPQTPKTGWTGEQLCWHLVMSYRHCIVQKWWCRLTFALLAWGFEITCSVFERSKMFLLFSRFSSVEVFAQIEMWESLKTQNSR